MKRVIVFLGLVCFFGAVFGAGRCFAQSVRYQDESGNIFFVDTISQVPERYRSQVIPPTTLPPMNSKQWKIYQRNLQKQKQLEERQLKIEERRKAKEEKLAAKQKGTDEKLKGASKPKQVLTIMVFVGPNCAECSKLERTLREHKLRYKKLDITKSREAFVEFDRMGVGTALPVTKIGSRLIKGNQPQAILEAAGLVGNAASKGGATDEL